MASRAVTAGGQERALKHFDMFYRHVYGSFWPSIRIALLSIPQKAALYNNFCVREDTLPFFEKKGAFDLMNSLREFDFQRAEPESKNDLDTAIPTSPPFSISADADATAMNNEFMPATQLYSMDDSTNQVFSDAMPVVGPSHSNIAAAASASFNTVKQHSLLEIPQNLRLFGFNPSQIKSFNRPKPDTNGLFNFYPMEASILPVLALNLKPGDRVLDMCAAPGGKSIAILQTRLPSKLVCLEKSATRIDRLSRALSSLFPQSYLEERVELHHTDALNYSYSPINSSTDTEFKGGSDDDATQHLFDKVLIDAPCSSDRHVLTPPGGSDSSHSSRSSISSNNLFSPGNSNKRLALPGLQLSLLRKAASLLKPGGSIVYSTCTLSPAQNQEIVQRFLALSSSSSSPSFEIDSLHSLRAALELREMERQTRKSHGTKKRRSEEEESSQEMGGEEVDDDTAALATSAWMMRFYPMRSVFGLLTLPYLPINYGPMFMQRLRHVI